MNSSPAEMDQRDASFAQRAARCDRMSVGDLYGARGARRKSPSRWRNQQRRLHGFDARPAPQCQSSITQPAQIGDVEIPEGEKVYLSLGGANRDPRRWPDPDRFDISRRAGGHVGFGDVVHGCVGQLIARIKAELVLTALARRATRLELAGEPVRRLNNTLRGFTALPLRIS
jgi:hypothetical protein